VGLRDTIFRRHPFYAGMKCHPPRFSHLFFEFISPNNFPSFCISRTND
jgi:hypothetical protein